jgi:methionine synthase II (cobalamin-independent)
MKPREEKMADRILTTHVGSLPRTAKLLEFSQKRSLGEKFDQAAFDRELKDAVGDVVRHQKEAGVDLVNDGELGHTMGWAYDYGSWWSYVVKRLSGVEVTNTGLWMTTLEAHTKAPMAPRTSSWAIGPRSSRKPTWTRIRGADCPSSS